MTNQKINLPSAIVNEASGNITVQQTASGAFQVLVSGKVAATDSGGVVLRNLLKALKG